MKVFIAIVIYIFLFSACAKPKPFSDHMNDKEQSVLANYESAWMKIDSLEKKGMLRSALEEVYFVYNKLDKNKEKGQLIKSIFYLNKYLIQIEEDGFENALIRIEKEYSVNEGEVKAIIASILGELYYNYAQRNSFKIQNRTNLSTQIKEDVSTWTLSELVLKSNEYYNESLKLSSSEASLSPYFVVIQNTGKFNKGIFSSLFEFLAGRALDHFTNKSSLLVEPVYSFEFNHKEAFSPLSEFLDYPFVSSDTNSFKLSAVKLYQRVFKHYLQKENKLAIAYYNTERLKFAFRNNSNPNKDILFKNSLQQIVDKNVKSEYGVPAAYALSAYYFNKGMDYRKEFDIKLKPYLNLSNELISNFSNHSRDSFWINQFKQLENQLKAKSLNISVERVIPNNKKALLYLRYRNIDEVHFKIISLANENIKEFHRKSRDQKLEFIATQKAFNNWSQLLSSDDFNEHAAELSTMQLPLGEYLIVASDREEINKGFGILEYGILSVSDLSYQSFSDGFQDFILVTDRSTGVPLQDVKAEFFRRRYNQQKRQTETIKISESTSNSKGIVEFTFPVSNDYNVRLRHNNDVLDLQEYDYNYRQSENKKQLIAHIFTDRNIYRPGQIIYFKSLLLEKDKKGIPDIVKGSEMNLILVDQNNQEIEKLQLKTNDFGSVQGSFTAPKNILNGRVEIRAIAGDTRSSSYINIEEYKRPGFEVVLDQLTASFIVNDTVDITGYAQMFAGPSLSEAKIRYRVTRVPYFPYRYSYLSRFPTFNYSEAEIANGELKTDAEGKFSFPVKLKADESIDPLFKPFFQFKVQVEAIDITGETQSIEKYIQASYDYFQLEIELPETIDLDQLTNSIIHAKNLEGSDIDIAADIEIVNLKEPESIFHNKYWGKSDTYYINEDEYKSAFPHFRYNDNDLVENWPEESEIVKQSFDIEEEPIINLKAITKDGVYKLKIITKDAKGHTAKLERIISITDNNRRSVPNSGVIFTSFISKEYRPGDEVQIQFSSPIEDLGTMLFVEKGGQIVKKEWVSPGKFQNFKIPVYEEDRGNFLIHLRTVYQNRIYQKSIPVNVPWRNKELQIEYSTIREKIEPGSSEEWQIKIKNNQNEGALTEVLANMYDASLDKFVGQHNWNRNFFPNYYSKLKMRFFGFHSENFRWLLNNTLPDKYPVNFYFQRPVLNWFRLNNVLSYYPSYYGADREIAMRSTITKSQRTSDEVNMEKQVAEGSDIQNETQNQIIKSNAITDSSSNDIADQIRSNFDENVFFFPDLKTDKNGNLKIVFKMNDAISKWRFLLFTHSKNMEYAFSEKEIITQKELMIVSTLPRFLREKDQLIIPAKGINLSQRQINATASIFITNGLTGELLNSLFDVNNNVFNIKLDPKESKILKWPVKIPDYFQEPIDIKVEIKEGLISDAETKTLPILSNEIVITESEVFHVRGGEYKTFRFQSFANQFEKKDIHSKLFSLEYTSHPIWYAVQALPYMVEQTTACSEHVFSRFYANALANSIVSLYPKIQHVFERWMNYEDEALLSNLRKNQALKTAILEETPWLIAANQEEQQKKNIALLFDLNKMKYERSSSISKLTEMQLSNGGFPWFSGGRDNRYITQYILTGIGRLVRIGAIEIGEPGVKMICDKGVRYADEVFVEEFEKYDKTSSMHLDYIDLYYMYMRSLFSGEGNSKQKKYKNICLDRMTVDWPKHSVYAQSLISLILHRAGFERQAKEILNSLKERAIYSDELGMYWKSVPGYNWYQLPIESHAVIIEAFQEIEGPSNELDMMRIWLLKQKQTHHWHSTKATAEAIYALLIDQTYESAQANSLLLENKAVEIKLGGVEIYKDVITKEAGTGYFKKNWLGDDIKLKLKDIEILNPNKSISWGAAYWQYSTSLDNVISFNDTALKIKKELFLVENTPAGPLLKTIDSRSQLKPGDRLQVRILIETDRDIEFVHLKDMRASAFEPVNVISSYKWQDGLAYYESTKDLATHFYISYLPRGKYVFEYPLRAVHEGKVSNGVTTIQSMYAPEFSSHSQGDNYQIGELYQN